MTVTIAVLVSRRTFNFKLSGQLYFVYFFFLVLVTSLWFSVDFHFFCFLLTRENWLSCVKDLSNLYVLLPSKSSREASSGYIEKRLKW